MELLAKLDFTTLAIISAFFGALANIFARILLKDVESYNIMGLSFLMVGSTLLIFSPMFYYFMPSWATIGLLYAIGIIDTASNYYYFKSFEMSEAGIATSLLALSPVITFIGSFLFLGTQTSPIIIMFALFIMISIVALSSDSPVNLKSFHTSALAAPILASVFYGLSSIPSKALLSNFNAINAPTLYMFRATIIGMCSFIFMRPNLQKITFHHYRLIWLQGLLAILMWVALYTALSKGNPGVTMTLSSMAPVFTVIFGALFLRERITFKKILSTILILGFSAAIVFYA